MHLFFRFLANVDEIVELVGDELIEVLYRLQLLGIDEGVGQDLFGLVTLGFLALGVTAILFAG